VCGIAGALEIGVSPEAWGERLTAMADALAHRGPDDHGTWCDAQAGVGLAHRRLSILDVSPQGHQPMPSPSGRFIATYNGEIYNFDELRESLGPPPSGWRGHSDTEVLLAGFDRWGVAATLRRAVGMFAMGVWDRSERRLLLVRDRFGVKPLYVGRFGGAIVFASELKGLRRHPAFRGEVDRGAVAAYLRLGYVPAPLSIYRDVRKITPGTIVTIGAGGDESTEPYWSLDDAVRTAQAAPFGGDDDEATDELDRLLRESVRLRMVSDVPLGAFLSGGIDSTLVVAAMVAQSTTKIRTFTIGFEDVGYDESAHAEAVARHLGTDHLTARLTAKDAWDVIPRLPRIWDEPFGDSSQIPTHLVSRVARAHVTVSLSGDGGDESFAGYHRYRLQRDLWRTIGWCPRPLRSAAGRLLMALPRGGLDAAFRWLEPAMARYGERGHAGDKIRKVAELLSVRDDGGLYREIVSQWKRPSEIVLEGAEPEILDDPWRRSRAIAGTVPRAMFIDTLTYLPDDILVKLDRASMAVGLEAREPLLDHRLVEFAWRLPERLKLQGGTGKRVLRRLLARYVPDSLVARPKMGFGIPLAAWLRGPLRDWAEPLLAESRLRGDGLLNPGPVRSAWREHVDGKRDRHYYLWSVLMLQGWLDAVRPGSD